MRWLLTSKRLKKEPKGQLPGQWRVQKHRAQEPQGGESAEKPVTSEASAKKSGDGGWGRSWDWACSCAVCLQYFHHICVLEAYLPESQQGPGLSKTLYLSMILKINVCLPKPWDQAWTQGCDLVQDCSLIVSQPFKELLRRGSSPTSWASCMPSSLTPYLPLPPTCGHTCFCCFYLTF